MQRSHQHRQMEHGKLKQQRELRVKSFRTNRKLMREGVNSHSQQNLTKLST